MNIDNFFSFLFISFECRSRTRALVSDSLAVVLFYSLGILSTLGWKWHGEIHFEILSQVTLQAPITDIVQTGRADG